MNTGLAKLLGGTALTAAVIFGAAHMMTLESEQRDVLKQLQEIKALLQARPAGAPGPAAGPAAPIARAPEPSLPATVSLRGAALKGRADAKLTLVEFSDFECPFCGRYIRDTFERIAHDYVDTGKVQYAFRNYPLANLHPHAVKASQAAECARQQGKFWDMHTRLFANQQKLGDADLRTTAGAAGVELASYDRCVASESAMTKIRQDQEDGARAGVTGTPFFFLGVAQPDGSIKVMRRVSGAQPYEAFKSAIDALLASN